MKTLKKKYVESIKIQLILLKSKYEKVLEKFQKSDLGNTWYNLLSYIHVGLVTS